ncbi:hypothetical protein DSECCO2_485140 [anaerobic digester metagenome]
MFTRLFAKALSLLGFLIGFTSEVLAQYGAPVYFFTVKGSVKDIECQNPVKNAKVKLIDRNGNAEYNAVTDSLGNFIIWQETLYWEQDFKVTIEDQDGKTNGQFKTLDSDTHYKKYRLGWHNPDTIPADIYFVKYISGSPCKNEPVVEEPDTTNEPDPAKEPEPEVTVQDSAVLPQEEPVVPPVIADEYFTNVNLFPNPNSGHFAVEFTAMNQAATDVYIYSSDGALIYNMSQYAQKGANHFDLELEGLAPGMYYIRLHCFQNDVTKTFVVQ